MSDHHNAAPMSFPELKVVPEWIDYNGHMNVAFYVLAFDKCVDEFLDRIGLGQDYVSGKNCSSFTLEMHVNYLQEVVLNDPLRITCQLLDHDRKRAHYFMRMEHATEGYLAATTEQLIMHVDLGARRSSSFPPETLAILENLMSSHGELEKPAQAGRVIGLRKK